MKGSLALGALLFAASVCGNWVQNHMKEEHQMEYFDWDAFFRLHDLDSDGVLDSQDVRAIYGLDNVKDLTPERKLEIEKTVFAALDADRNGAITLQEFKSFMDANGDLPDFGFEGHHGDDELEFDIHHVMKYHTDPEDSEENWSHPEDIEHFAKHNLEHHDGIDPDTGDHVVVPEGMEDIRIVVQIPEKFRRKH
ncbi:hypothetical protein SAICODRAFT_30888 [Saitoella complicata NRRL Y-17804]|nr:uncharacterized protein SAICODRAFT_30888 [Saitoella complicata NRRL Y-17804]ODQ52104.1 hypothetical protein SAICODRAFT_30888 [Saitoella complicata NRRL Y-17804]